MKLVCISALIVSLASGQNQETTSSFEVISIKPPPKRGQSDFKRGCTGNRFLYAGAPLANLVTWTYDLPRTRIQGLPDWVNDLDSAYEIEAKASTALSEARCKASVRSLFADRFKRNAHIEPKEMRAYALSVTKKGSKMRDVNSGSANDRVNLNGIPFRFSPSEMPRGISMSVFATRLSAVPLIGLPVIDRTGLPGIYSFDLNFSIRDDDGLPSISTALEEQLGLKLEPIKAPMEVLVVDRIEKPTAN